MELGKHHNMQVMLILQRIEKMITSKHLKSVKFCFAHRHKMFNKKNRLGLANVLQFIQYDRIKQWDKREFSLIELNRNELI